MFQEAFITQKHSPVAYKKSAHPIFALWIIHAPLFLVFLLDFAPFFLLGNPHPAIFWSHCEPACTLFRHPAGPWGSTTYIFIVFVNPYRIYQAFMGKFAQKIKSCINLSVLSKVSPCKVGVQLTCFYITCTVSIFPKLGSPCPLNRYRRMLLFIVVVNLMSELVVHHERLLISESLGCLDAVHKIVPPCLSPLKFIQSHPLANYLHHISWLLHTHHL